LGLDPCLLFSPYNTSSRIFVQQSIPLDTPLSSFGTVGPGHYPEEGNRAGHSFRQPFRPSHFWAALYKVKKRDVPTSIAEQLNVPLSALIISKRLDPKAPIQPRGSTSHQPQRTQTCGERPRCRSGRESPSKK
jgi:hypothetical protein